MDGIKASTNILFLLVGDAIIFFLSLWSALAIRQFAIPEATFYIEHIYPFTVLFLIWVLIFFIAGLYDEELLTIKRSLGDTLLVTQTVGATTAVALFYLVPFFDLTPKTNLALFLILFSISVWMWRKVFFTSVRPLSKDVLLVGSHPKLEEVFSKKNFYGFSIIKNLAWSELKQAKTYPNSTLLLIDYSNKEFERQAQTIHDLVFNKYKIIDTRRINERLFGKVDLSLISHQWFVTKISQPNRFFLFIKRALDILAALILLTLLIVLLPLIALWMLIEEKSLDLFFIHTRAGQFGKPFIMYKLRSMRVKDGASWDGENHERITKLGTIIRALRIDELPQAINILKGDISLVGPRAILESEQHEMEERSDFYHLRLFAKPGITGWAQIKQPHAPMNPEEAQERLSYDLYYLQHQSIVFDVLIILKTIKTVILKTGIR